MKDATKKNRIFECIEFLSILQYLNLRHIYLELTVKASSLGDMLLSPMIRYFIFIASEVELLIIIINSAVENMNIFESS